MPDPSASSLARALESLSAWLETEDLPSVIIGGVAVSVLAEPRFTNDIDLLVWSFEDSNRVEFLKNACAHGFEGRIKDPLAFASRTQMLLLRHAAAGVDMDVVFAALPVEERMIGRRQWVSVGAFRLPFPSIEDLCVLKAVAGRPRDLADLETLFAVHPKLDYKRVAREVRQLAKAIESPESMENLKRIREGIRRRLDSQISTRTDGNKRRRR